MREVPLYNSSLLRAYTVYIEKYYPEIDVDALLDKAGIDRLEVEDDGHWFTQSHINRFHEILQEKTGNLPLAREVGRHSATANIKSPVRQYILGFITPTTAYSLIGTVANKITRAADVTVQKLGEQKVVVTSIPREDVKENPFQCENRIGNLEALAKMYTGKFAEIEHPECLHRGDKHCRYIVSWESSPFSKFKRMSNYLTAAGMLICLLSIPFLTPIPWIVLLLSCLLVLAGFYFMIERLEKKDLLRQITDESDMADRLLNEINFRYNENLLIREVGEATSKILDIDALLKFIMDALETRSDFDRGMIMLADKERKWLRFVVGYGYGMEYTDVMKNVAFHLDKPGSKGPAVVAFKEKKPYLVTDINDIKGDLTPRSLEFAKASGTQSFLCVPIVYKDEALGVLVVDKVTAKQKVTHSEMSLLMGIAPQIAISINNALSYQKTQESEQRFRSLSENAPDIIYTLDSNGAFTYINPAWEKLLGHPAREVLGKPFIDFIEKRDVDGFLHYFERVRSDKTVVRDFPLIIPHMKGPERHFTMSGAPNLDAEGGFIGLVGTLKDVTEQRNLEDQLRHATKMEAVGTLTSGISHDFNNIIQAISGYNQLLLMRRTESDPDWKYLNNINKLIQRSSELIRQLLIFSRKMESRFEPLNLSQEIEKFYELIARSIPRMISVRFDMDVDLYLVSGDRAQLGQVIMNMAINAGDAMPDGGEITISTRNVNIDRNETRHNILMKKGHYALIRFSDTGHGMDRETLDRIFEPFFTTKDVGKGTGLGLSVVYGIVKNHNGYIICESEQEIGTTFYIYLPALDHPYTEEDYKKASREEDLSGTETILLVDDEKYLLEGGRDILNHFGYDALVAETGEDALEVFKKERDRIHLVIMDLIMPGMGGLKCLSEILKIDPATKVVIASGYAANIKKSDLLKNGAAGFVQKPYHLHDLLREIRRVIDSPTNQLVV
ncbi:MAG: PAS domain S-box protein [Deltaproteobacteria bacterium]|nr:PAS domain S-box protein [Deltaproteobacteria bacterium]